MPSTHFSKLKFSENAQTSRPLGSISKFPAGKLRMSDFDLPGPRSVKGHLFPFKSPFTCSCRPPCRPRPLFYPSPPLWPSPSRLHRLLHRFLLENRIVRGARRAQGERSDLAEPVPSCRFFPPFLIPLSSSVRPLRRFVPNRDGTVAVSRQETTASGIASVRFPECCRRLTRPGRVESRGGKFRVSRESFAVVM